MHLLAALFVLFLSFIYQAGNKGGAMNNTTAWKKNAHARIRTGDITATT